MTMMILRRLQIRVAAALVVPLVLVVASAADVHADAPKAADAGAGSSTPACVLITTDSRWVPYGYRHIVIVKNGCSRNVSCMVSTDVNPEKQSVDVTANTTSEVVTFQGSPSSTFVANVACHY